MCKSIKYFLAILLVVLPLGAKAQSPQNFEKQIYDAIEKEVERHTRQLELDEVQIFLADSVLTHDYFAMQKDLEDLSKSKMSISDAYVAAQDKWMEAIYNGFKSFLREDQWQKYLKYGAQKEKKARDKRAEKRAR